MVNIESSVEQELLDSLTENEDLIRETLQQKSLEENFDGQLSDSERQELYAEIDDEIDALYANSSSIVDELEKTLETVSDKIPFVEVETLKELAEDLKKAAEMGALIGGTIALAPVLFPYFEYTSGASDGPIIGFIMGAVIGAMTVVMVSPFSPLAASVLAAAFAVGLCGISFPDIQEKYFNEFKKAA